MVRTTSSLADLPEGSIGTIRDIDALSPTARRLLDMGFVPGTVIRAIKRAPMGDPTTYEIRGYQVGLRRSESSLINVEIKPDVR
ncbi:MAG TPA: FeoA family protein [Candidatus Rifleibacterium sp.]|nr:FeoA family protein [Candidatus Rifleibacterium sp.]HPT48429.1 FeoA family protein [Candidatus Rifleibacterium sp.]